MVLRAAVLIWQTEFLEILILAYPVKVRMQSVKVSE